MPDSRRKIYESVMRLVKPKWEMTDRSMSLNEVTHRMLQELPHGRGVPVNVRRMMASRRRPEHKLAILSDVYGPDNVQMVDGNFLIWDDEQRRVIWADEKGLSMKDLIDFAPVAMEAAGGVAGAIGGGLLGGPLGAAGGGAGGATAARAFTDRIMSAGIPEEAERTVGEGLRDTASDLAFNSIFEILPAARALRGTQRAARETTEAAVEAAARRELPLTAGEGSGFQGLQGIEVNQGKFLGGSGPVDRFVQDRQQRLVQLSDEIGRLLSGGGNPATAAEANAAVKSIADGLSMSYDETLRFLESNFQRVFGADTLIEPTMTLGRLAEIQAAFPGAAEGLGKQVYGKSMAILQRLGEAAQANGGRITFEQMRTTRTMVNDLIREAAQVGAKGQQRALRRIAGYMTEDMAQGAAKYGGEEATRAWDLVNQHIRAWRDEANPMNLSTVAKVVGMDGDKRALAWALDHRGVEGSRKLFALRRGASQQEWDVISSSVFHDLGQKEGQWVPMHFLRNYSKLAESAKSALWGGTRYEGARAAMDDLAKVLGVMKAGTKGLNFSNTTPTFVNKILTLGGVTGGLFFSPKLLIGAGAVMGANNLAARLFRNQAFVNTLTATVRVLRRSPVAKAAMIRRLLAALSNEPEEVREYFLSLVGEDMEEQPNA